jgi:hypothetical protein
MIDERGIRLHGGVHRVMSRFTGTFLLCAVLVVAGLVLLVAGRDAVQFLGLLAMILAVVIAGCAELSEKWNEPSSP